jgi:hypothetical protein
MKIGRIGSLVLALAWGTLDVPAQDKAPEGFWIKANRMQRLDHVFTASGNVEARVEGWRFRAESLEVRGHPATAAEGQPVEIIAEGNVVLERGDERLRLRRLQFEPRSGRGIFELQQP